MTHHDVANGGGKFIVDAWLVEGALSPEVSPPNGAALFATVHGEFAECTSVFHLPSKEVLIICCF